MTESEDIRESIEKTFIACTKITQGRYEAAAMLVLAWEMEKLSRLMAK